MSSLTDASHENANNTHQVHDNFFIRSMSDLRVAKDFLQQNLPSHLLEALDLSSLEICKDKLIATNLKSKITDILYRLKFKNSEKNGYISTLIEHQSTPQKYMPLRVLYYESTIMYTHWNNYKTVPLVYTMVYYNGEERWKYSHNIKDLIDAPSELVEKYAIKPFHLLELNKIDDEKLRQHLWAGAMSLAMKHIYDRDILPVLRDMIVSLKELEHLEGNDFVLSLLYYIHERSQISDKSKFQSLIASQLSNDMGDKVMTLAQLYIQEGKQEGAQKERLTIAQKLLEKGFKHTLIKEITGIDINDLKQIEKALTI